MPNGRGKLECCYCEFYRCHNLLWRGYDAMYEAGECLFHHAALPASTESWQHRVCRDFQPNEFFQRSAQEQFGGFPFVLAAGVLYGFGYNTPEDIHPIAQLGTGDSPAPSPVA